MAKPAEICEEFRLAVYEKYKDQGWKYLKSTHGMKKVVKDLVFKVTFSPSFSNQENVSACIEMRGSVSCKSLHKQGKQPGYMGQFSYEPPFGQSWWWELIDPKRREASVLEAQKQIDATMIPLTELFERDYRAGAEYLAGNGFINPVITPQNACAECRIMFIDKVLGREAAERVLRRRYALWSYKRQHSFENGLLNCEKIMDEVKSYLEHDHYRVDYETYYIVENQIAYKNEPRKAGRAVNITILQNPDAVVELNPVEIAESMSLGYGVADNNGALEQEETGHTMVFYNNQAIGRGIDVAFGISKIELQLSLPASASEIKLYYELAEHFCSRIGAVSCQIDGEAVATDRLRELLENTKAASREALVYIDKKIQDKESENVVITGAMNPITLGKEEIDRISGTLEGLGDFLHELQERDVFFADPEYIRRPDGTIFGVYFVGEQIVSVVPKTPYAPFGNMEQVDSWYVVIPDSNGIPYEEFIRCVDKLEEYDAEHVIVSLTEEKIYELTENCAVDMFTREPVEGSYGGTVIDEGETHLRKIRKNDLPVEERNAYNHLAVFLRWMCEHEMLSALLLKELPNLTDMIQNKSRDLRDVIAHEPVFGGKLKGSHFNKTGKAFAKEFYQFNLAGAYPACVDRHAEDVLGTEKYHSAECGNEAYLFVPYDEAYYQGLSKYIDEAWEKFNKK